MRQRVTRDPALQLDALLAAQLDHVPAPPGHHHHIRRRRRGPFNDHGPNFRTRVLDTAESLACLVEATARLEPPQPLWKDETTGKVFLADHRLAKYQPGP